MTAHTAAVLALPTASRTPTTIPTQTVLPTSTPAIAAVQAIPPTPQLEDVSELEPEHQRTVSPIARYENVEVLPADPEKPLVLVIDAYAMSPNVTGSTSVPMPALNADTEDTLAKNLILPLWGRILAGIAAILGLATVVSIAIIRR